jgi:flagellar protein FlbD
MIQRLGESEIPQMIALTRLNGQSFVINAEKIRYVESTPDTVICCDHGEKMMVRETLEEVMRRAIDYSRIIRRAVTE